MRPSLLWVILLVQVATLLCVVHWCHQTARLAERVESLPTTSDWCRISDMIDQSHGITQMRVHDWLFPRGQAH